ncbi:MAG: SPFH domain-containing protein [Bacteroidales bacterium]|nr:SPFH domain-containing protein [Bacteroidales bacterium]
MGLISALVGSAGGVLADQWKEFFYCEAMPFDVLMKKGEKVVGGRSSNTKGSDNIISNGSKIAVADGQCMIIVEQGKIVEVCAEPGEFIYDTSSEPSIFYGGLGKGILNTFKQIGKRFTFGGDTGKDQRVYYFNTKELMDNKFGTNNPIPFRVCDSRVNLDIDVDLRLNGVYSYRIADPLLFYTNVCANVPFEFKRSEIDTQLKTEFVSALQPALAKLSALQMRPSDIPAHAEELSDAMNEVLSKKWGEMRGLAVVNVAMNPITLTPEDAAMIKAAQKTAMYMDPNIAIASRVEATNTAMVDAANNANGAVAGIAGVGMINGMGGGSDLAALNNLSQQQKAAAPAATWTCANCGNKVDEQFGFCPQCGTKKPAPAGSWTCSNCGNTVNGNFAFCPQCCNKKPEAAKCANCGAPAPDPSNPPKFCPNCGKPFFG